jgi:heat shock protein HslJ
VLDRGGTVLRRFAPERDVALVGRWALDGLVEPGPGGASGAMTAVAGERAELVLGSDATVSGSDGCNRITTTYAIGAVDGDGRTAIRFGPVAATRMACEPDVMRRAGAFTEALGRVRAARIEGTTLSLFDAGGTLLLTLTRPAG